MSLPAISVFAAADGVPELPGRNSITKHGFSKLLLYACRLLCRGSSC
jgi:hypothetical protein